MHYLGNDFMNVQDVMWTVLLLENKLFHMSFHPLQRKSDDSILGESTKEVSLHHPCRHDLSWSLDVT